MKKSADVGTELRKRAAETIAETRRTTSISFPLSFDPNRHICVLWSLGCIGQSADFFTKEYQARLRSALAEKFRGEVKMLNVYSDSTKLSVPLDNFSRPVPPEEGYTLTVGEDITIYHCNSPEEIATRFVSDSATFSNIANVPFICTISDDDVCADYVSDVLKERKCPHYHVSVGEECMRKRPADRLLPMPAECTSYYGPLEILKDCIKRTQKKYNMDRLHLNSVRQLFDQLSTGEGFENVARAAESAGVTAVTRADGNEWISLTTVERSEAIKARKVVGVFWHLECIGPISTFCTVDYHSVLRFATVHLFGGVNVFHVYVDTQKLPIPSKPIEFHDDWPVSIIDCEDATIAAKHLTVDALWFARNNPAATMCLMADGRHGVSRLTALISSLKALRGVQLIVVDVRKECMTQLGKKTTLPLPQDCRSFYCLDAEQVVINKEEPLITTLAGRPPPFLIPLESSSAEDRVNAMLDAVKDCIQMAQEKAQNTKVSRSFVCDLLRVLYAVGSHNDAEKCIDEANDAGLIRMWDTSWVALSTDAEWIDQFARRNATVRRYANALRRARITIKKFEGVTSSVVSDLVAIGVPQFAAADIVSTVQKHLVRRVGVFWNVHQLSYASTFWTTEYHAAFRQAVLCHFGQLHQFNLYTKLPTFAKLDALCIPDVCDITISNCSSQDAAENRMLVDALWFAFHTEDPFVCILSHGDGQDFSPLLSKLKMRRIPGIVIDVRAEALLPTLARTLPLPCDSRLHADAPESEIAHWAPQCAGCLSMWDKFNHLEDLRDCILEAQQLSDGQRVVLRSVVGALFRKRTSLDTFKRVVRDAEACGEVRCGGELNEAWIAFAADVPAIPAEWLRLLPQTGDVDADVRTLFERLRQQDADRRTRELCQSFEDAERNRDSVVKRAHEIEEAHIASILKERRNSRYCGERLPTERELWGVTVRFNPSFEFYDELSAFCLDPDERSLQVATKPERRGNWQCMTIQPFGSKDDADEFFSARLAALKVKPKIVKTTQEFGNVACEAENAQVDGKEWISLTTVEHNEAIKAVELVPHEEKTEICVHWSLRRIGPSSDFFTSEYQARLRSALTAQFERDGVAPIIVLHVYADTTKVTVPIKDFIRPEPKKGSELKYTLTTGETWTTTIYHCVSPEEIAAHFVGHATSSTLALRTEAPIICTVSDDDECGSLVADALEGSKCQHYHVNVSEECMRKRPDERSLPMPAECISYYGPREILKDCIKRTQTNDNMECVPLGSVRQLFDQLDTGEEFENVARDAENAGAIAVSRADGNEWISVTPVKWGEWVPTEGNVPADEHTLKKYLRQETADRRTRELCQSLEDAEKNRDSIIKDTHEMEEAHYASLAAETAIAKKKANQRSRGERRSIEREDTVPGLSASQPIEYEIWSVSLRFSPKFECYDQLIAFRLDPDEPSLQVSTITERRGNWQCMTIHPFGSQDDAEEFSRMHFSGMQVSPKIAKIGPEQQSALCTASHEGIGSATSSGNVSTFAASHAAARERVRQQRATIRPQTKKILSSDDSS